MPLVASNRQNTYIPVAQRVRHVHREEGGPRWVLCVTRDKIRRRMLGEYIAITLGYSLEPPKTQLPNRASPLVQRPTAWRKPLRSNRSTKVSGTCPSRTELSKTNNRHVVSRSEHEIGALAKRGAVGRDRIGGQNGDRTLIAQCQ